MQREQIWLSRRDRPRSVQKLAKACDRAITRAHPPCEPGYDQDKLDRLLDSRQRFFKQLVLLTIEEHDSGKAGDRDSNL